MEIMENIFKSFLIQTECFTKQFHPNVTLLVQILSGTKRNCESDKGKAFILFWPVMWDWPKNIVSSHYNASHGRTPIVMSVRITLLWWHIVLYFCVMQSSFIC